jgi:hypothetical protein
MLRLFKKQSKAGAKLQDDSGGTVLVLASSSSATPASSASLLPSPTNQHTAVQKDRRTSQQWLDMLPAHYKEEDSNAVREALENLPDQLPDDYIENELYIKDAIKEAIDKRLSAQVMANYEAFMKGMQSIHDIKAELVETTILCKSGRRSLNRADEDIAKSVFLVVAKQRKKARLLQVLRSLTAVQAVIRDASRVEPLLESGDILAAISVHNHCKQSLKSMSEYTCLNEVRQRFQTSCGIEDRLHSKLVALCCQYDEDDFCIVVKGFIALGQAGALGAKLRQLLLTTVDDLCKQNVIREKPVLPPNVQLHTVPLRELTLALEVGSFRVVFLRTVRALAGLFYSMHAMRASLLRQSESCEALITEHITMMQQQPENNAPHLPRKVSTATTPQEASAPQDLSLAAAIVADARKQAWSRAQLNLSTMLAAVNITTSSVPLEEFLQITKAGHKLLWIGDRLTGDSSIADVFRTSVVRKSSEYVSNFNRESFDQLRVTLDNEMWRVLPLPTTFSAWDVKELRSALGSREAALKPLPPVSQDPPQVAEQPQPQPQQTEASEESEANSVWNSFLGGVNPLPQIAGDEDSGGAAEEKAEAPLKPAASVPLLSSSALNVAHLFGKSIQIMSALQPLALDSLRGLTELFQFYLYAVFKLFGVATNRFFDPDNALNYPELRKTVRSVRDRLQKGDFGFGVFKDQIVAAAPVTPDSTKVVKLKGFNLPGSAKKKQQSSRSMELTTPDLLTLQPGIDIKTRDTLNGLIPRCVAAESVAWLCEVLALTENYIRSLLPRHDQWRIQLLVSDARRVSEEFRTYMIRNLAPSLLPFTQVWEQLAQCKFDIKDMPIKHNLYVDVILRALQESEQKLRGLGGLPPHVMRRLWVEVIDYAAEQLVVGYSKVKKCTPEGRALMSLDLQTLKSTLETMTDLRPLPKWDHVVDYVQAYYLDEKSFLKWITDHRDYTIADYLSIAQCGMAAEKLKKKDKAQFLKAVEDLFNKNQADKAQGLTHVREKRDDSDDEQEGDSEVTEDSPQTRSAQE